MDDTNTKTTYSLIVLNCREEDEYYSGNVDIWYLIPDQELSEQDKQDLQNSCNKWLSWVPGKQKNKNAVFTNDDGSYFLYDSSKHPATILKDEKIFNSLLNVISSLISKFEGFKWVFDFESFKTWSDYKIDFNKKPENFTVSKVYNLDAGPLLTAANF